MPLEEVTDVALGWGVQACAITRGGLAYCWGKADSVGSGPGAIGDGGERAVIRPQPIPLLSDAVEIKAGMGHTCARRRNGQVLCWGLNGAGELGDGTKLQRLSPVPVVGVY